MGGLTPRMADRIDKEFSRLMNTSFNIFPVESDDFAQARVFLQTYRSGLRAGDALHLAVASNRRAKAIYSLDKKLILAAKALGLPASYGIKE